MRMSKYKLLVCDLDNTLYDWVSYFVASFHAMVDEAVKITGCDRERLLNDFRAVHRYHQDAEHPFALLETESIQQRYPGKTRRNLAEILDPAFHAFNVARKQNLALYPGVREGLDALRSSDFILVAHTESKLYSAVDRLSRLDLEKYFSKIYCRRRSPVIHPTPGIAEEWLSLFPMDKVVELSHAQRKPNPDVLKEIYEAEGVSRIQTSYCGDSLARDVMMARDAGVLSIWARYGSSSNKSIYKDLVRVTHWTEADVVRERELTMRSRDLRPDFTLEKSFIEILEVLLPKSLP